MHELSRGVPRRINLLCDRALLGAFANSQPAVDKATVDKAAAEVFDKPAAASSPMNRMAAVLGLGLVAGAGLFAAVSHVTKPAQPSPAAARAASASADVVPAVAVASSSRAAKVAAFTPAAPGDPALLRDPSQAWRELAQAWNATAPGGSEPCRALQKQQIQCFSKNLSLSLIRELGRPGILTLDAQSGAPSYALLTGLGPGSATLRAAGTEQTVTLAALAARWGGDFSTLWRAPPGYNSRAGASPTGDTAEWLAERLAAIDGTSPVTPRGGIDAAIKTQLRGFQLAHGLPADGQPGPLTYMQLNRAAGVEEPRLRIDP